MSYDLNVWGVGVSALLVLSTILYFTKKTSTTQKPTKRASPPAPKLSFVESMKLKMSTVEKRVRETLEPLTVEYYAGFTNFSKEDKIYKFNYIQEELLKELIKLDGVELSDMTDMEKKAELKSERKELIKYIQGLQKQLDAFKKEHRAELTE